MCILYIILYNIVLFISSYLLFFIFLFSGVPQQLLGGPPPVAQRPLVQRALVAIYIYIYMYRERERER